VVADPPGEHRLSPVLLHLEVEGVRLRIPQRPEPDRLATSVDCQGRVLAWGLTPWLLFGRDEDVPWRRVGGAGVHLDIGWTKMRTRTERPGLPRSLGRGGGPGARGRLTAEHARQQDAGGRERPEKPSTVILPLSISLLARFFAKPVLSSARCRRTRPQARKPSVLQPDPLRRAARRPR
jgi:hypothetical protein